MSLDLWVWIVISVGCCCCLLCLSFLCFRHLKNRDVLSHAIAIQEELHDQVARIEKHLEMGTKEFDMVVDGNISTKGLRRLTIEFDDHDHNHDAYDAKDGIDNINKDNINTDNTVDGTKTVGLKLTRSVPTLSNTKSLSDLEEKAKFQKKFDDLLNYITQTMDINNDIVMIYVHGVNMTEDDVSLRMDQFESAINNNDHDNDKNNCKDNDKLKNNVRRQVLNCKFGWKSTGSARTMYQDRKNARSSVKYLVYFINQLSQKLLFKNIVFVAHSAGNIILYELIMYCLREKNKDEKKQKELQEDENNQMIFNNTQFISFASPLYKKDLEKCFSKLDNNFLKWTSYFNPNDKAIALWKVFHSPSIVEKMQGEMAMFINDNDNNDDDNKKLECIDCSEMETPSTETGIKSHSYMVNELILKDLAILIRNPHLNPKQRQSQNIQIIKNKKNQIHWKFKKR